MAIPESKKMYDMISNVLSKTECNRNHTLPVKFPESLTFIITAVTAN